MTGFTHGWCYPHKLWHWRWNISIHLMISRNTILDLKLDVQRPVVVLDLNALSSTARDVTLELVQSTIYAIMAGIKEWFRQLILTILGMTVLIFSAAHWASSMQYPIDWFFLSLFRSNLLPILLVIVLLIGFFIC